MATRVPLQSISLTSDTSSVTFSNIDQSYTDLQIVVQGLHDGAGSSVNNWRLQFNGDTGSNYSDTFFIASSTSPTSSRDSNGTVIYAGLIGQTSSTFFPTNIIDILSYSSTTKNKSLLCKGASGSEYMNLSAGTWRNTSAITSIKFFMSGQNIKAGATFDLYGISPVNAKTTFASGGTNIFYDSSYVYHVFTGTGTFTPNRALTADVLVVAGGGGGGSGGGGGAGAGGVLNFTSQSLTSGTTYTCLVGAAGVGGTSNAKGSNGTNSQFAALTAAVGGGGGAGYSGSGNNAQVGGSGGGGTGSNGGGASNNGALGTSGQGTAGGNGGGSDGGGGGGGGAAVAGGNGTNGNPGAVGGTGGNGTSSYSSWLSAANLGQNVGGTYYIAGGGGGGSYLSTSGGVGGYGGGATGGKVSTAPTDSGVTNSGSGGGGGGAGGPASGSNGGSGFVIVRYAR